MLENQCVLQCSLHFKGFITTLHACAVYGHFSPGKYKVGSHFFSFQCLFSAQQGCPTYPKFCWVRTYNIFVIKCRTCTLLFFSPFWTIVTVFTVARFHWWALFLSTGLSILLVFLTFIALLSLFLGMPCYILMCRISHITFIFGESKKMPYLFQL